MATVPLTAALRAQYQQLFDSCLIGPDKQAEVNRTAKQIEQNRQRYDEVSRETGVPWYFVAAAHCMESSLNFTKHLHNGDPLTARTQQVPAGRPKTGNPPFTWSESAADALRLKKLDQWTDWTIPGVLYRLEGYNGFGYRLHHPEVFTPYLWSFSNHYTRGKYVSDGTFSPTAVSKQMGCAVLLRRLSETGAIKFNAAGVPIADDTEANGSGTILPGPMIRFSRTRRSPEAEELQRALNRFPGIFVKVDGVPGERTSDAFRRITGSFLDGDPRA